MTDRELFYKDKKVSQPSDGISVRLYSKEWANNQLKFGIRLLKGDICNQDFNRAISDVISIRTGLKVAGFWWQAKRLTNHINLAKKRSSEVYIVDDHEAERSEVSHKTCPYCRHDLPIIDFYDHLVECQCDNRDDVTFPLGVK
jgi:hypothetical protein